MPKVFTILDLRNGYHLVSMAEVEEENNSAYRIWESRCTRKWEKT